MAEFITGERFTNNKWYAAGTIVALFSGDILLPVPSSAVCAVAGRIFGISVGTLLCWFGLNISTWIGYLLGWYLGWTAISRFSSEDAVGEVKAKIDRWGIWAIVLFRAIPVLAEASILMLGTYRYASTKFWPAMLLANFIFAACFVSLGKLFSEQDNFLWGLGISCVLPVLLLLSWSWLWSTKTKAKD